MLLFISLGGNAMRGGKMVPLIPDVFPSNEGIYVCVCPECHFFPLGNGSETIYHCEHVDGNRRFQMGFAK